MLFIPGMRTSTGYPKARMCNPSTSSFRNRWKISRMRPEAHWRFPKEGGELNMTEKIIHATATGFNYGWLQSMNVNQKSAKGTSCNEDWNDAHHKRLAHKPGPTEWNVWNEIHLEVALINRQVQVSCSEPAKLMLSFAHGSGMRVLYKSSWHQSTHWKSKGLRS